MFVFIHIESRSNSVRNHGVKNMFKKNKPKNRCFFQITIICFLQPCGKKTFLHLKVTELKFDLIRNFNLKIKHSARTKAGIILYLVIFNGLKNWMVPLKITKSAS